MQFSSKMVADQQSINLNMSENDQLFVEKKLHFVFSGSDSHASSNKLQYSSLNSEP